MDPRRRCGAEFRLVRPAPRLRQSRSRFAAKTVPSSSSIPTEATESAAREKIAAQNFPEIRNKAWPSGADGPAPKQPQERIHCIATADRPEISLRVALGTPPSSFILSSPLTPRRRSPFSPSPVRRARKQIPSSQAKRPLAPQAGSSVPRSHHGSAQGPPQKKSRPAGSWPGLIWDSDQVTRCQARRRREAKPNRPVARSSREEGSGTTSLLILTLSYP